MAISVKAHYEQDPVIHGNYEYLDHTAGIQLHSWGDSLEETLGQIVVAMFGYMTQADQIQLNEEHSSNFGSNIEAKGHDIYSLVFTYLQEWLLFFMKLVSL